MLALVVGAGGQCPIRKKGRCVQNGTIAAEGRKRTTMRCWPRPLACRPSAIRRGTNPRGHFFGRAAGDDPMMTMAFSSVCSLFPPFPWLLFLFPFRPKSHFICLPRWRLSYWVVASSPFCREQNTKLLIGPPLSFLSSFIVPHTLDHKPLIQRFMHRHRSKRRRFTFAAGSTNPVFLWTPSLVRSNRQQ